MTKAGEYIDLLRQLICIPSPSFGEDGACSLLSSFLDSSGLPHRRHGNNLIVPCRDFSPERKTLAMLAHVDTVPPADGYTRDPYDPGTDDSIIYGLGANDDGGSVVSMIATFRHFLDNICPSTCCWCSAARRRGRVAAGPRLCSLRTVLWPKS